MKPSSQVVDSDKPLNWKIVKSLIPFLKEYRVRTFVALLCLIIAKLLTVTIPLFLKYLIDILGGNSSAESSPVLPAWVLTPIALVIAYGAFRFGNVLFNELRDTLFSRVTERAIRRISVKVFERLHTLDISFHLDRRTGGLARDIERGRQGINFLMRFMIFNIIPTLFEISLVIGILLSAFGFEFGLVTSLAIVAYGFFTVVVTNWRNKFIREANEADSDSNTVAIDSLLNYETVKYFTNENYEAKRYDKDLNRWEKARLKNRMSLLALNSGQALIISIATALLMYLSVVQIQNNQMSVGDLAMVNAYIMQLFIPLNFLGFVYREIRTAFINIEKMFGLLNKEPKVKDIENAITLPASKPLSIHFNNISFGYSKDRNILNNVSFSINTNETVALVGSSGAGKSTIAKLLLRFYDSQQGTICFDDYDIKTVSQKSLRQAIGVVPQDTVLFNDTLLENIRYGNINASDEEVNKVVKLAHLDQFISQLPKGIKTTVGERGLKLSGGEKQRVAIARALLKKPPIMIFDEATSSLDSHSENAILSAIKEISANYTSVVIAHRLSTIVDANKIIVLNQGEVIEVGNHNQLIAKNGHYASLWNAQQSNNL